MKLSGKLNGFREVEMTFGNLSQYSVVVLENIKFITVIKMGREILEPGCLYHIYNHAVGTEKLFLSEDNYNYFLRRYEHFIGGS